MKEFPILFTAPMVRALLDGGKIQTRRVMKPQPRGFWQTDLNTHLLHGVIDGPKDYYWMCPYGQPGDHLWVRETFIAFGRWETRYSEKKKRDEWHFVDMTLECDRAYQYAADNPDVPLAKGRGVTPGWWTRPAIFMPRAASRILLEIVSVRVERLSDISEDDALAEGCFFTDYGRKCGHGGGWKDVDNCPGSIASHPQREGWMWDATTSHDQCLGSARSAYGNLWESINGVGSWAANPFVWRIEFKRVTP